jgi:hypothetical protein
MAPEPARALVAKLKAVSGDAEIAWRAAARELLVLESDELIATLGNVIRLSRAGDSDARAALGPLTTCLRADPHLRTRAPELSLVAERLGPPVAATLFAEGPAQLALDARVAAKADAQAFSMTLGHLKSLARLTRDPDQLSRLCAMSTADVVRNALLNPRLTEPGVVRMAARRPSRPEPLVEIWRSPKWSSRYPVRRALAFNPYLPVEVGAKIVPLLTDEDLRALAAAGALHPALREQARILTEL